MNNAHDEQQPVEPTTPRGASGQGGPGQSGPGQGDPVGIRRHLFFGLALLLAFGSMYAGVLNQPRLVQYGLAVAALVVVLVALNAKATPRR